MKFLFTYFIITSTVLFIQGSEVRIDSLCKIQSSNTIGSCQRRENCRSFKDSSQLSLPECFTDKSGPVICCPDPPIRINQENCFNVFLKSGTTFNHDEVVENETVVTRFSAVSPSGGVPAEIGEFRQMAAIGWLVDGTTDQIDFKCGGTLIDRHYVVTAAHCMATQPYLVRLGGVNISNKTVHPDDIIVTEHYIHPNYTSQSVYNDIAILKLNKDAITWDSVPACLWTDKNVNFTTLVATGYGQTSFAGPTTDDLIKVNLKYFGNTVCNGIFDDGDSRYANGIVDSQLCAGLEQGKQDTCPGDSGGPIGVKMVQTNAEKTEEIFYLIGVTSFGSGCGGADAAVYTRISSFLDWIESIVWYVR